MNFYRLKQFLWSLSFNLNDEEASYIKEKLTAMDIKLFNKLSIAEQKHCIRVAKSIEHMLDESAAVNTYYINRNRLIKAALLHDIGKIYKHLGVISKSVLVILDKITSGRIKKYDNIKSIHIYYNHAEEGAQLLERYGYDEGVIFLVKNHHSNLKGYAELDMLKYSDSLN